MQHKGVHPLPGPFDVQAVTAADIQHVMRPYGCLADPYSSHARSSALRCASIAAS